jgi:hypothetical protein
MKSLFAPLVLLLAAFAGLSGCSQSPEQIALAAIQEVGGKTKVENGHVTSVDLSGTQSNDAMLATLAALPKIHTVNCTNVQSITGAGLESLVALPELHTLYMAGTSLDDAGMTHVAHLKSLKTLNIGYTKVTDAGMPALDKMTGLKTLVMGHTAVSDAGLVQLRDLRDLSTIILKHTKVTPKGAQELRRSLPNARVEY